MFNSHQSNSFPASAGVLCEVLANSVNARTIVQPPISEENQQQGEEKQQSEIANIGAQLQQVLESAGGGMTATLNNVSFTTAEIITVNGSGEE